MSGIFATPVNGPANSQAGRGRSQQKGTAPMITNNNQQTAEANLRLAADAMERTGWTVARLIAASVERGKPGRPAGNAPDKCISGKVSIRAGAELLRKGQDTIRDGELIAHYRGRKPLIRPEDLEQFVRDLPTERKTA